MRIRIQAAMLSMVVACSGCATASPYTGQGPHRQITRGAPFAPVDLLGQLISLPYKLILWNWEFNRHSISQETESMLISYLDAYSEPAFEDTVFRLNQYSPIQDLKRLAANKHVAWPYRILPGLLVTLVVDVILPGRLFPWGDHFNPFTNTVYLYSDDSTIALHEAGHSYDIASERFQGTYAVARMLPLVDLYQEWRATDLAVEYLIEIEDRESEFRAYKTLWPAYGTYGGGYLFAPIGTIAGALIGHIAGRYKARRRKRYYDELENMGNPGTEESGDTNES